MAKKEPATVTWSEVCKKVQMGDGLYSTCREKVSDFPAGGNPQGGFRGGALDEVPSAPLGPPRRSGGARGPAAKPAEDDDFDAKIAKTALKKIPDPPSKTELAKFPPGYSHEPTLWGFPLNQLLMYGGVAFLVWFFVMRGKTGSIIGTETPAEPASSDVTPTKAA